MLNAFDLTRNILHTHELTEHRYRSTWKLILCCGRFCNLRHVSSKELNLASSSWHLNKNFISLLKQKFLLPNMCMFLHTYLCQWLTAFQWILQACKWDLTIQTLILKKKPQQPNRKELRWETRKTIMLTNERHDTKAHPRRPAQGPELCCSQLFINFRCKISCWDSFCFG